MANITQELGFDVQKALASLDSLNKSISSFNRRIGSLGKTLNRFNTAGNAAAAVFNNVNTASGSVQQGLNSATKSTERLTVSWQLLTRVVVTQLIVRSLRRVQATFTDAAKSAIEFGTRVEEIQTIANGTFGTSTQLSNTIRQLSDEFGSPILDTAAGLYQTISNQIGNSAREQVEFTRAVQVFAKVGVASVNNSVNLLSGTLNAYGKGVIEVNQISSQFFRTIELGRTTASELAGAFGRVVPFGEALGVNLSELQGILAGLTIRGIKTTEAVTQMRGILNSLLKPTQEMRAALERLGFATGEQAVRTLGLVGTIKELRSAGGDFNRLFPRIRARAGAEAIANQSDAFDELNRKISETENNLTNLKFAQFIEADSQKAIIALNKLKNFFTVDVGPSLVKGFVRVIEAFQDVSTRLGQFTGFSNLTPEQLQAFRELEAEMVRTKKESEAFSAKLEVDFLKAQRKTEESIRKIRQSIRGLSQQFIQETKDADFQNTVFTDRVKDSLNRTIRDRERLISVIKRQVSESLKLRDASEQRVLDIRTSQSDRQFEFDLRGFNQLEQFDELLSKARREAGAAAEQINRASDPQVAARATQQFQRAIQFADRARQLAVSRGDRTAEEGAVRQINVLLSKQVGFELQLQKIQTDRADKLRQEQVAQEKRNQQLRESAKLLLANLKTTDETGAPLSGEALARQQRNQQKALADFQKSAFQQKDLSAFDILGLTRLIRDFQADFQRRPIKLRFDVEQGARDAVTRTQAVFDRARQAVQRAIGPDDLQRLLDQTGGGELRGISDLQRRLTEFQSQLTKRRTEETTVSKLKRDIEDTQKVLPNLLKQLSSLDAVQQRDLSGRGRRVFQAAGVRSNLPEALGGLRGQELDNFILKSLPQADKQLLQSVGEFNRLVNEVKALGNSGDVTKTQVDDLTKRITALRESTESISQLQNAFPNLTAALLPLQKIAAQGEKIKTIESQFNLNGIPEAESLQQRLVDGFARVQRAATINVRVNSNNQLDRILSGQEPAPSGRAHGGPTQGSDTINALLSPGETVVNARQSRRHFAMLQALNADQRLRLNHGGAVTNVGDVTVNVNESSSPRMTARAVASELRREFRRGTSKL